MVIQFSDAPGANRTFFIDVPTVWLGSFVVRDPPNAAARYLVLSAQSIGSSYVEVSPCSVLHMVGVNARLRSTNFFLRGVLSGNGTILCNRFDSSSSSFVVPGTNVPESQFPSLVMPPLFRIPSYGRITILPSDDTVSHRIGGTIVLKNLGPNASPLLSAVNSYTYDSLYVSRATLGSVVLVITPDSGLSPTPAPAVAAATPAPQLVIPTVAPGDTYQFTSTAFPQEPSDMLCIGGDKSANQFSVGASCSQFLVQFGWSMPMMGYPTTDPLSKWVAANGGLDVRGILPTATLPYSKVAMDAGSSSSMFGGSSSAASATSATSGARGGCDSASVLVSTNCCPPGFSGPNCATSQACTSPCLRGNCLSGQCLCSSRWTGESCDIPSCPEACSGAVAGQCVGNPINDTLPTCVCNSGFQGMDCSSPICPSNCNGNGVCDASSGVPMCFCYPGFDGPLCNVATSGCPVCQNGGTCQPGQNVCTCPITFTGPACQAPVCPNRCSGNGICSIQNGSPTCTCAAGYSGPTCAVRTCSANSCLNGGVCVQGDTSFTCACPPPKHFVGQFCQFSVVRNEENRLFPNSSLSDGAMIGVVVACVVVGAGLLALGIILLTKFQRVRHERKFKAEHVGNIQG